jgi:hypothetical protein
VAPLHIIIYNHSVKKPLLAIGIVFVASVAWYLGSPLFIDSIVEEELPASTEQEPLQYALVSQGTFQDADSLHKGEGSATAYAFPDGSTILRFEDFSVTNGPALSVFLTKNTDGIKGEEAYNVGKLKGNKGDQNYDIPASIDLSDYESVLIYCVPFKTPFASATLQKI